jgi:hypothetical protein
MCPDNGAIQNKMLHIRVIGKMLMHFVPNIFITPAAKAFIDTIPVAILCWQQPPLGAATGNPKHSFNKSAALRFLAHINLGTGPQKLNYFGPLFVFYPYC